MIQVKVRVISGSTYVEAVVCAESLNRAVELAGLRYPWGDVEVVFPIDPGRFFAIIQDPETESILPEGSEAPEATAAGPTEKLSTLDRSNRDYILDAR